jgi:RTX calcium-binding nonapeptide repeat (4 copies)
MGSFDNGVLIGDAGPNILLGQPGVDSFYGRGGEDVIVAVGGTSAKTGSSAPHSRRIGRSEAKRRLPAA